VLSPTPVKPPSSSTSPVQQLLGSSREATPRGAVQPMSIAEPSYGGPGVLFEKGEGLGLKNVIGALPTDEERDVLET